MVVPLRFKAVSGRDREILLFVASMSHWMKFARAVALTKDIAQMAPRTRAFFILKVISGSFREV